MATRGRRPGSGDTRQAILLAARKAFAENGFDRARLRSIADEAGVDPSLIVHFFGSKRELYEAAVAAPPAPVIGSADAQGSAHRVINDVIAYLDRPEVQAPFVAEVRSALTADELDSALDRYVFLPLNAHLFDLIGGADAVMRHATVRAELTGVVFGRYIFPREPLASAEAGDIASAVAPTIEVYLQADDAAEVDLDIAVALEYSEQLDA